MGVFTILLLEGTGAYWWNDKTDSPVKCDGNNYICVLRITVGNSHGAYTDLPTLATKELCESTNVKSFWSDTCYEAGITDRTSITEHGGIRRSLNEAECELNNVADYTWSTTVSDGLCVDHTDIPTISSISLNTPYNVITTLNDKNLCLESFTTEWVNECYEDVTDRNNPTAHTGAGRLEGGLDFDKRKWNCEAEKFFKDGTERFNDDTGRTVSFRWGPENDGKCVDTIKDRWLDDDMDKYKILSPSIYDGDHSNYNQLAPYRSCTWIPDNTWTPVQSCADERFTTEEACTTQGDQFVWNGGDALCRKK